MPRRLKAEELDMAGLREHLLAVRNDSPGIPLNALGSIVRGKPTLVQHYTDVHGLIGIVESGELLATDIRFLNDWRELEHGISLVDDAFRAHRASLKTETARNATKGIVLKQLVRDQRIFVFSFSERFDDLGQWRGYGGGAGPGYALQMPVDELVGFRCSGTDIPAIPIRMDYSDRGSLSVAYVDGIFEAIADVERGGERVAVANVRRMIAEILLAEALRYKDEAFHEEHELRLAVIASEGAQLPLRFLPRRGIPVPRVRLTPEARLPLASIVIGPGVGQPEGERAVRALLDANGYRETAIRYSATPFRG